MFFALRNKTQPAEWSNYTTNFDYKVQSNAAGSPGAQGGFGNATHWDPIAHTQLIYENTVRLDSDNDFFSLIHPYLFSDAVPHETGYHMWTYSIRPWDPLAAAGSTNYSKLANVQVRHTLSPVARFYMSNNLPVAAGTSPGVLKLANVFLATNWNIARVANGSLGHPTM
jgi:hypothetical protein